jgi:quercetin dioxygenase-like cupin family protein
MEAANGATVLTPEDVARVPPQPLGTIAGVEHRVLWHDDTSIAGVMTVAGGHHLGEHEHRRHSHHMWMLDGSATILGTVLEAGSYVHIPAGVRHDIDARATHGCRVLYHYVA